MRTRLLRILKTLGFFLLLAGAILAAAQILERKESARKYADLKEAANADVLFLGSSHVINGINPVQLYEEFGIASYNLGGHGSILPASYYELLLALDTFSPQLVVVDGYLLEEDYHFVDEMTPAHTDAERESAVSQLHLNLDIFPLSRNKIYAVRDLIADKKKQLDFLFPFLLYHNRWTALEGDDFILDSARSPRANRLLGGEVRMGVDWRISPHPAGTEAAPDTVHVGEAYLQMIMQTCRERGIQLVFTYLPFNATAADYESAARMEIVAAAEDIPCLNYLGESIIDDRTDLNDEGHLNLLGMTKATRRMGEYLKEIAPLPDERGDKAYQLWQERAEEWTKNRKDLLYDATSLPEALLILSADPSLASAFLYLPATGAGAGDPAVRALLTSLVPGSDPASMAAAGEPSLYLLHPKEPQDLSGYHVSDWEESPLGSMEDIQVEHFTGLYLHDDESDNLLDMEDDRLADAQLVLEPENDNRKRLIFYYNTKTDDIE